MSTDIKCPHCQQILEKDQIDEIIKINISSTSDSMEINEADLVKRIKTQVLTEVQNSIEPLLLKLQEIGNEQSTANKDFIKNQNMPNHQLQLQQLQAEAMERLKSRENSIAQRMKKLQQRISRK